MAPGDIKMKKKTYNYEFDRTFDFENAPDPPQDYLEQSPLDWMNPHLDKSLGNMLLTRHVREFFVECQGYFPHFHAPELLDEQQFYKFCFHAEDETNHLWVEGDFPRNYIPTPYRDEPEEWQELRRRKKERIWAFKVSVEGRAFHERFGIADNEHESTDSESDNDSDDEDKKPSATELSTDKRPRSSSEDITTQPASTRPSPINILDMDGNVKSVVASNLNVCDWLHLRQTRKAAMDWPLPFIDYDFFYFAISNEFDHMWQGVAHTMAGVRDAMDVLYEKEQKRFC